MMELISRVRALLRRAEFGRERRETLRCGDIECDTTTHTMRACGEELTLDDDIYTGFNGDVIGCGHCVILHVITDEFEDE